MSFSQNLADLRRKRGLTQQVMADMLGIHVSQIKRYEKGTSQPTSKKIEGEEKEKKTR